MDNWSTASPLEPQAVDIPLYAPYTAFRRLRFPKRIWLPPESNTATGQLCVVTEDDGRLIVIDLGLDGGELKVPGDCQETVQASSQACRRSHGAMQRTSCDALQDDAPIRRAGRGGHQVEVVGRARTATDIRVVFGCSRPRVSRCHLDRAARRAHRSPASCWSANRRRAPDPAQRSGPAERPCPTSWSAGESA